MSMIINNNISALKAHRNLGTANKSMTSAIEKLSSGYKINVGADDPSGLVISEQLRSQISGLNRAIRNSSEAYNLISIAEGALNEMNSILKKMRALAIHAANEVTSPEQIEADQAELDSGIQTINRIANTSKYSDQFLLNGSKELVYDVNTNVNDTGDHPMLDIGNTRIDQVFKRTGVVMSIAYTGYKNDHQANTSTSAQRAYYEADSAYAKSQVVGTNVTAAQKFILTGTSGSKQFSFPAGTSLGTIVSQINNSKDSTGVGATLTFASNARIDKTNYGGTAPDYTTLPPTPSTGLSGYDTGTYMYQPGDIQIYGAKTNNPNESKISSLTVTPTAANAFVVGKNCDGDGKIYAKVIDAANNEIEWYKDKDCTMLIGKGDADFFAPANNSGIPGAPDDSLDGLYLDLTANAEDLDVYEIAVIGQRMENQMDFVTNDVASWADMCASVMSGVNLGVNTDPEGNLFFKYIPVSRDSTGSVTEFKVEVYRNSNRDPSSLVGTSGVVDARVAAVGDQQAVTIEAVDMELDTNPGHKFNSGLNITMMIPPKTHANVPQTEQEGTLSFTNLGMRIYASDYGSDEYVRIQNQEGELFYYYREADTMEKIMVQGEQTVMRYGQDASLGMNGTSILTNGLVANVTTSDFSGRLVFDGGELGLTSIAVAGHEKGSLYSRAEALQGVEEKNSNITRDDRYFEPRSLTLAIPGMQNSNGKQLELYLDFSDLDPSVRALIDNYGGPQNIIANYIDSTTPPSISINAAGLSSTASIGLATFSVDPDKFATGFKSSEANMKGLFLKTNDKIDLVTSVSGTLTGQIQPYAGDKLIETMTYATNPRTDTIETVSNFQGGMQFQLGNTSGDQDRTVYSIQSMDIANLGKVEWNGIKFNLQDAQSGGVASLMRDPIMAMRIIEQAVTDVSTLRSRLGAFQANMLQTNINSLEISVENLTDTESAIRSTDMASESTEFTKNQIMVQASTSMLAQANSITQNVLSLLQ